MPDMLPFDESRLPKWAPFSPRPAAPGALGPRRAAVGWALSHWAAVHTHQRRAEPPPSLPLPAQDGDGLIQATVHDMRNALSAIRLGMELISRRADPRQSDAVLEHVDHAASRAIERSEELVDVCRLAAGKTLDIAAKPFSLHAVVRQAVDALASSAPSAADTVFEHDRLGDGECGGDSARVAQFLNLAFEELASAGRPARVIVVSEVAGERFRIAICEGAAPVEHGADERPDVGLARMRRRVLMHGIAGAHQGRVDFDIAADGRMAIEGSFRCIRRGLPAGD